MSLVRPTYPLVSSQPVPGRRDRHDDPVTRVRSRRPAGAPDSTPATRADVAALEAKVDAVLDAVHALLGDVAAMKARMDDDDADLHRA